MLLDTDAFFRKMITAKEFQKTMSTARVSLPAQDATCMNAERALGLKDKSLLAVSLRVCRADLHISSPGDSSIGMNVAAKALQGNKLAFDPSLDANETAAIVLARQSAMRAPQKLAEVKAVRNPAVPPVSFLAVVHQRTSCCKPNRRFRKCWALTNADTTIFCK